MNGDPMDFKCIKLREKGRGKEKRRRRPLTKGIRTELRTLLENVILSSDSALLSSAFSPCQSAEDNDGTIVAPLSAILFHLQENGHNIARFNALSNFALKSIANRTRTFTIVEDEHQKQLFVRVNPHIRQHNDEKTVFVDNLPPLCTAERLKRRAAFFGRVVATRMPQILRIQRRIAQMIGGVWPVHSGFAFVQFASKTAAKRFCKRYLTNSRLKRIHHHGHKHGRRRANTTSTNKNVEQKREETSATMENTSNQSGKGADHQETLLAPPMAVEEAVAEHVLFPPLMPSLLAAVSKPNNSSNCSFSSGIKAEVRFRCNSVAEESVLSESGNETDTQMGKIREYDESTEGMKEKQKDGGEGTNIRKRKRRRRRPVGHRPPFSQHQSLNSLFRHIQVFSLKQYRELRMDYLRIKKTRMSTLKKQLTGMAKKGEEVHPTKTDNEGRTDQNREKRKVGEKRTKRRRKRVERGVRKLLGKAERAKAAEYAKDGGNINCGNAPID